MRLVIKIGGKYIPVFGHPHVVRELHRQAEKAAVPVKTKRSLFDSKLRDKRFVA